MNIFNIKKIIFFLLFFINNNLFAHVFQFPTTKTETIVKVLLEKRNSYAKSKYTLESSNILLVSTTGTAKTALFKDTKLDLIIQNDKIFTLIKDITKNFKYNEIEITSSSRSVKINGKKYTGSIIFKIDPKSHELYIISKLNLDEYLYSVLASEIYPTWPHEMQKIQAVISRTYAVYHMNQNMNKKLPYDIKNNNFHQKYDGHHYYKHLKKAIDETYNVIITYNNKPILAMFDSCCGGITTANISGYDFKTNPYLSRKSVCNFCSKCPQYKWEKRFNIDDLLKKLKEDISLVKKFVGAKKLLDIKIIKKDKAGIVKKIKFIFSNKNVIITGNQLWDNFKNIIYSLNFNIKKNNNKIIFMGNGYGHQIGLCQYGAKELVDRGWDYKKIISFYYPGTNLGKLQYAAI